MRISGEEAALYDVIRRDSCATVNAGPLVSADDETGEVSWRDRAGETKSVKLDPHVIHIQRKTAPNR